MRFETPLVRGRLLRRYKRFLADVHLDTGEEVTASCPNTGAMLGLCDPGLPVWLSRNDSPARKYRHTWEMVETATDRRRPRLVGINTGHPNKLVAEAIRCGGIPELGGYADLRSEQKYGAGSRIDLLLEDTSRGRAYVEIKNVHLMRTSGLAEFPDCVTARGAKHLRELAAMVAQGHRAVMVYLVQREDADALALADDIDRSYADAFAAATEAGVEALAYRCRLTPQEITIDRAIPIRMR